jgi:hypothetical protein
MGTRQSPGTHLSTGNEAFASELLARLNALRPFPGVKNGVAALVALEVRDLREVRLHTDVVGVLCGHFHGNQTKAKKGRGAGILPRRVPGAISFRLQSF